MAKDDLSNILFGHLEEHIRTNYSQDESFSSIREQVLANQNFAQLDRNDLLKALDAVEASRTKDGAEQSAARLLVDWGEMPQVGRNARPMFSLITSDRVGRPTVRIQIDRSLDNDPTDPLRQLRMEEDGLWTFYVPFSLTTNGLDAKPGLYVIDVEVTFPHTEDHHPRFLQTRIRLNIPNAGSDQRELVIDGDGQSVVNLAGHDLKSFSKVVLKGDDRGIINLQNFGQSQDPAAEPEQPVVFEYELKINREIHDRLPRLVDMQRPSKTDAMTLVIGDKRIHVIARKRVTFGRSRENDICLRFLPRSKDHDEGSRGISKTHVAVTLSDDGLVFSDEGSTHGFDIDYDPVKGDQKLDHLDAHGTRHIDLPSPLSSAKLSLQLELAVLGRDPEDATFKSGIEWDDICFETSGESPSRLWHVAKGSGIESARIRRLNNLDDEEYVFLYRHATIGRSAKDHAIVLAGIGTLPGDLRLVFAGRMFWLHSTGAARLAVDGEPIEGPCLVPLMYGHCLSINGVDVHVARFSQFHLHDDPVLSAPSAPTPLSPPSQPVKKKPESPQVLAISSKHGQGGGVSDPAPPRAPAHNDGHTPKASRPDAQEAPSSRGTSDPVAEALASVAVITGHEGHGSGFLISPNVLVTNYHVIADDPIENLKALFFDPVTHEQRSLPVSLLAEDPKHDLAFLSVASTVPPLKLREHFEHRNGHRVAVIGSPGIGETGDRLENVVSDGRLGPGYSSLLAPDRWSLSITLNPGNSGGPVLDAETGDVLGVTVAKFTTVDGLALAIPNTVLADRLHQAVHADNNPEASNSQHRQRYCLRKFAFFASAARSALDEFTCQHEEVFDGAVTISKESLTHPFLDTYGEALRAAAGALEQEIQPQISKLSADAWCSPTALDNLKHGKAELFIWEKLLSRGEDAQLAAIDELAASLTTIETLCSSLQQEIDNSLLSGRSVFDGSPDDGGNAAGVQPIAMGGIADTPSSSFILNRTVIPKVTSKPRYLTKSRFMLASTCPTKLFYTSKSREYANSRSDDATMQSLANEGNRVGALARLYFPEGILVESLNHEAALQLTADLLTRENVTIFEAAIKVDDLFIRADILRKSGDSIELFEVKSKVYDAATDGDLKNNSGIVSAWLPYIRDVSFQKHVLQRAFPNAHVQAFLFLPNKSQASVSADLAAKCLNATRGQAVSLSEEELASPIMRQVNVDSLCETILEEHYHLDGQALSFNDYTDRLAEAYREDRRCTPVLSSACLKCEFDTSSLAAAMGLKSGRRECWSQLLDWSDEEFDKPLAFEIGGLSAAKKQMLLDERRLHLHQVTEADINPTDDGQPGLSQSQRQWLQVWLSSTNEQSSYLDSEGLKAEMDTWVFPLHFIDFETCRAVIPFHAGSRPSTLVAFQFSHHTMQADGSVAHANEFLCAEPGINPNAAFVAALCEAVGNTGTILHYAPHEVATLRSLGGQLRARRGEYEQADDLLAFIDTIAPAGNRQASRSVVDLCKLVKRFYYAPSTRGSNSIKQVLPAVLNESEYLQQRYGQPIYGAAHGIPSHNFSDMAWVVMEDGMARDPYTMLPATYETPDAKDTDRAGKVLRDGGAAMQAYADLQLFNYGEAKRDAIQQALRRYCELDTLAMVFIVEAWQDWCR